MSLYNQMHYILMYDSDNQHRNGEGMIFKTLVVCDWLVYVIRIWEQNSGLQLSFIWNCSMYNSGSVFESDDRISCDCQKRKCHESCFSSKPSLEAHRFGRVSRREMERPELSYQNMGDPPGTAGRPGCDVCVVFLWQSLKTFVTRFVEMRRNSAQIWDLKGNSFVLSHYL